MDDAEYLDVVSELFLNLEEDGTVKGRTRVSSSIYRIVLRPECEHSEGEHSEGDAPPGRLLLDTEEGPIPVDARDLCCDAETVSFCEEALREDGKDGNTPDGKTPARLRKKVLDRDGHRCRCCGGRLRLMVHHIRFLSRGGRTRADNLITVCATCHGLVHESLLVLDGKRQEQVRFRDNKGNALHEPGSRVGSAHLIPLALIPPKLIPPGEMTTPRETTTLGTVTLKTVPDVVDGAWWRRHSHLIRFRSGQGLEFRTGEAAPEGETQDVSTQRDMPTQGDDDVEKGEAFDGLVGLDALLRRLRNAANGSKRRGRSYPHTLFVGPPGTGKTTLARGVATAFGSRLHATSGPLVEDTHALLRLLASLERDDILFIDEIHAVPRPVLEVLYEAMAGGQLDLTLHAGALARSVRLDLPSFTLLAATTEEGDLPNPLRSRFGRRESLSFYTDEDLAAIATAKAAEHGTPFEPEAASVLATLARGTPRETLRLMECVLDETALLPAMLGEGGTLDESTVRGALKRLGYDEEGLDPTEQQYVAALRESAVPIPLNRLARMLGASARTLVEHVEPYLFRRGFVRMTAQGRQAVPVHHSCPSSNGGLRRAHAAG